MDETVTKELIFNIFFYKNPNHDYVEEYGVVTHTFSGTDKKKYEYLKEQVIYDYKKAKMFPISDVPNLIYFNVNNDYKAVKGRVHINSIVQMLSMNIVALFEEMFRYYNASSTPLYVFTIIENDLPVGVKTMKQMKKGKTETALLARGFSSSQIRVLLSKKMTVAKLKTLSDEALKELTITDEQITNLRKESRPAIDNTIVNKLLFESKRTCCICRDAKKPIIIHHIEEWHISRDNSENNLVVLCLEHHDLAHTSKKLSMNLKPEQIRDAKQRWIAAVKKQDALTLIEKSSYEYARWDYINLQRFFELLLDLNEDLKIHTGVFQQLKEKQIVNDMAFINDPSLWKTGKPSKLHFFNFAEGFLLAYHMKMLITGALEHIEIRDITHNFDLNTVHSSIEIGDLITIHKGFYFKAINKITEGRGQLRKAYYKKDGLCIKFVFDAYECTSTSAWGDHLTGHNVIIPILRVLGIVETDEEVIINTSCLAIGSFFKKSVISL